MTQPDSRERNSKLALVLLALGVFMLGALALFFYYLTHSGAVG